MVSKTREFKAIAEMQKQENQAKFFDEFERLEQKTRLTGKFPEMAGIVRLDCYNKLLTRVYGKTKAVSDGNGNLKGFETKDPEPVKAIHEVSEIIKKEELEMAVSIDGAGRKEYIKTSIEPKQDQDEEKEKDMIDKLADAIG